jgi:aspartyl-tRNA(Asn)/glutamyl-tRNA(Gln) amidotransferase subunit C
MVIIRVKRWQSRRQNSYPITQSYRPDGSKSFVCAGIFFIKFRLKYSMSASKLSISDLEHIAKLARIELTDAEKDTFLPQLESVIEYFDILNQVNTDGVEPTYQVNNLYNVLRTDEVTKSLPVNLATSTAARTKDNYFVVTATIKK